jgi:hypothetical protein
LDNESSHRLIAELNEKARPSVERSGRPATVPGVARSASMTDG